ncbi:MAG: N-acetylgalactosamine-6-sulfatase [Parabacteroides johnsonii]|nr:N-acetylgalactosamine-6-sulfatase [Parabacteroides johnsonii]
MKNILLGSLLLASPFIAAQEQPNIIIFLVDDMGLMDTSLPFLTDGEGNPVRYPLNDWYRTPNMERLARQGIRFSTFYAQSVSSPSRASIMTGQNAARHRTTNWINKESNNRNQYGPADWNWKGLDREMMTLPRLLQSQGYRTIQIGKAHFGCGNSEGEDPRNVGFDVKVGGSSIGHPGSYYGQYGYGHIKGQKARAVPDLEKYHGSDTFLTDALTIEANAQIDSALKAKKPFFLYMGHYAVHTPFEKDDRFISHYASSDKSDQAKAFATLIEGMDKSLGDIMDHLEAAGIAENTLVVFLGDNGSDAPLGPSRGYSSSAPLRGKKGSEFEGGMRVPCIIGWGKPDASSPYQKRLPIAQNAVQTQMGTVMDVYPTLATLTGAKIPATHIVDGQDLSRLLSGRTDTSRKDYFLMHFPHNHRGSYFTTYREDDWKLIYYYNPEHSERPDCILYNLAKDPEERQDISDLYPQQTLKMLHGMIDRLELENALYPVNFEGKEIKPDLEYFQAKFAGK